MRSPGPLWLLVVWLAAQTAAVAMPQPSPRDRVRQVTEQLITALQVSGNAIRRNPALAYKLSGDIVLPIIDFETISRRVLGRHWRTATPEQRRRFTAAFRQFLTDLYVRAMVTYSEEIVRYGQRLRFPRTHWRPGDERATVRMLLQLQNGLDAEVRYRLHWRGEDWRITDVRVLGLSVISTYRQRFAEEIKRDGLDGLIERLARHNRERRAEAKE